MAKIANVFGRLEAFCFSILLYTLGYIQQAASQNIQTYAAAQIFYSAGFTGVLIVTQVFIADTTDLRWRALFSSLPDVPFLFTVWIGPIIASALLPNWRWGYGMWAIIMPVVFLPLALALYLNSRKAKKSGYLPPRPWSGLGPVAIVKQLWTELDLFGLMLLSAAISLILIPLTLGATAAGGFNNRSIIAMLVVGCLCLVVFPFWESSKKLAPFPFIPLRMLLRRNVAIGCVSGFFYFGTSVQVGHSCH
jgi:MFS family permease